MRAVAIDTESIEVHALRVGMFVHLDVGWMSHPFPLSSFRIATPAQIDTIRSLGVARVRWSPEQSDAATPEHAAPELPVAEEDGQPLAPAQATDAAPGPAAAASEPALSADDTARAEHRRLLDAQNAALRLCERQYAEAARECKQTIEIIEQRPHDAKDRIEALSGALVEKMLDADEVCIRMLVEGAADRASMHAMNVGIVSLLMGRMLGLPEDELRDLGCGAMLHDIGKLDLPLRMRWRDESFSPSEVRVWEEHVELGVAHARRMGLSAGATAVIAQHHEHADATGFPQRLDGDQMSLPGRVCALVNAYDNLCNPRLPSAALTPHEALSLLFAQGRSRFDAPILASFIRMMGVYPPGSTVQLTDDRYAQVVSVNASRPLKPSVVVVDLRAPRAETLVVDLERMQGVGIRRSLKPQQLPPPALEWLGPMPRTCYFFEPAPATGRPPESP